MPIITAEEIKVRNGKIADKLLEKCILEARRQGIRLGHAEVYPTTGNNWVMNINNSAGGAKYGFHSDMFSIINTWPRCQVIGSGGRKGHYDWATKVYTEDCSSVEFTIK